jgi:hypothetical protein
MGRLAIGALISLGFCAQASGPGGTITTVRNNGIPAFAARCGSARVGSIPSSSRTIRREFWLGSPEQAESGRSGAEITCSGEPGEI